MRQRCWRRCCHPDATAAHVHLENPQPVRGLRAAGGADVFDVFIIRIPVSGVHLPRRIYMRLVEQNGAAHRCMNQTGRGKCRRQRGAVEIHRRDRGITSDESSSLPPNYAAEEFVHPASPGEIIELQGNGPSNIIMTWMHSVLRRPVFHLLVLPLSHCSRPHGRCCSRRHYYM